MKTLREQYAELRSEALGIVEAAEKDGRKDLSDEETGKLAELLTKAEELQEGIKKADADAKLMSDITGLPELKAEADKKNLKSMRDLITVVDGEGIKSAGEVFVTSDQYKALLEAHPQGFGEKQRIQMDPVMLGAVGGGDRRFGRKDLIFVGDNTGTDGAPLPAVPPDFRGIVAPTFAPLMLRQLVSSGSTTSDLVEYVREVRASRDLNAASVAEATSTGGASGRKPESAFKFERAQAHVVTIAHHIPVTRKALADVGQARTLIDTFLTFGIEDELDRQIMAGAGGEEFDGIAGDAGLTPVSFSTDLLTTTRKAKTALMVLGVNPTSWVFNPADAEGIDLLKDGNERFYGNGPFSVGPDTLWGIPRAWSNNVTAGTAYLGDWRSCILYDREATTITAGTIDDQFVRNMLTLLAEMRAAFTVQEPFKIAEVDISAS